MSQGGSYIIDKPGAAPRLVHRTLSVDEARAADQAQPAPAARPKRARKAKAAAAPEPAPVPSPAEAAPTNPETRAVGGAPDAADAKASDPVPHHETSQQEG